MPFRLLDRAHGLLFTGDTYYPAPIWLYRPETNLDDYVASVKRLAALAPQIKLVLGEHNVPFAQPSVLPRLVTAIETVRAGKVPPEPQDAGKAIYRYDGISFPSQRSCAGRKVERWKPKPESSRVRIEPRLRGESKSRDPYLTKHSCASRGPSTPRCVSQAKRVVPLRRTAAEISGKEGADFHCVSCPTTTRESEALAGVRLFVGSTISHAAAPSTHRPAATS